VGDCGLLGQGRGGPVYVFSTDIFYDVDDAVSLVLAARLCENLVVVTSDETRGRRAQLTRHMLDLLDRPEVPVFEGIDLGANRFLLDDQLPATAREVGRLEDLADLLADAGGRVVWVGQGPMGELAHLLMQAPHLAESMWVTQMGGWLDHYRRPDRASHNLDSDQRAAEVALRLARTPRLVLSDHTNVDEIAIWPESELTQWLSAPGAPAWARLLEANLSAWWAWQRKRNAPARTRMHDPLTLSAGLGEPFVSFAPERIRILRDARTRRDPDGREMLVSAHVDYPDFDSWMHELVYAA